MADGVSRRESTKRKTRQALLEAGLAEILEKGIDRPSLDAICARAGFTRGAFYVHFRDREDFVDQLMDYTFRNFVDATVTDAGEGHGVDETIRRFTEALRNRQSPHQRMGMRMSQTLEASVRTPGALRAFRAFMRHAAGQLTVQVRRAQAAGSARGDVDAGVMAQLLLLLAIGAMALEDHDLLPDLERIRDALLRLIAP